MKKQTLIDSGDIKGACNVIAAQPGKYAVVEVSRFYRTETPGRKHQAALSAGRTAIAEVLFRFHPELGNKIGNLTKAIRRGMGEGVKFDDLNTLGAVALGLISE